jgi:drug/metabolite transporter (DMT)-like permease
VTNLPKNVFFAFINQSNRTSGYWALAAISFFWGTTWFTSKMVIAYLPAMQLTGTRQSIAGILLISFFLLKTKQWPTVKELLYHAGIGFLLFTCSNGLTTAAIQYIPSFLGALLGCLMPFFLILANFLLFKERVKLLSLIGLLVGFTGVSILLLSFKTEINHPNFMWGVGMNLIGVCTWTTGTLVTTRNKLKFDPFEGLGWQMLFGGILLLIISGLFDQQVDMLALPLKAWLLIFYLIVIGSIFCFVCYLHALKKLPLSLVSIYVYINPVIALLMGVMFLQEKVSLQIVVGVVVILLGIYLVKKAKA